MSGTVASQEFRSSLFYRLTSCLVLCQFPEFPLCPWAGTQMCVRWHLKNSRLPVKAMITRYLKTTSVSLRPRIWRSHVFTWLLEEIRTIRQVNENRWVTFSSRWICVIEAALNRQPGWTEWRLYSAWRVCIVPRCQAPLSMKHILARSFEDPRCPAL